MMKRKLITRFLTGLAACLALAVCGLLLLPFVTGYQTLLYNKTWMILAGLSVAAVLLSAFLATRTFSGRRHEVALTLSANPPRFWGGLLAVFLGLTAAIGLTGYLYTRHQESQQMAAAQDMLSSIADLKVEAAEAPQSSPPAPKPKETPKKRPDLNRPW